MTLAEPQAGAKPIERIAPGDWAERQARLTPTQAAQAAAVGFEPKEGTHLLVHAADGALERVIAIQSPDAPPLAFGALANLLPQGLYALAETTDRPQADSYRHHPAKSGPSRSNWRFTLSRCRCALSALPCSICRHAALAIAGATTFSGRPLAMALSCTSAARSR